MLHRMIEIALRRKMLALTSMTYQHPNQARARPERQRPPCAVFLQPNIVSANMDNSRIIVVMGVCGCGKSEIGRRLANALNAEFVEGDDFHPEHNVALMGAGIPLTDANRQAWLEALRARIAEAGRSGRALVLSCSALKRRYRDLLREGYARLAFVHLKGERAVIEARMRARQGHFMPIKLLDSQFLDLEPPNPDEAVLTADITLAPDLLVESILQRLAAI